MATDSAISKVLLLLLCHAHDLVAIFSVDVVSTDKDYVEFWESSKRRCDVYRAVCVAGVGNPTHVLLLYRCRTYWCREEVLAAVAVSSRLEGWLDAPRKLILL